MGRFVPALCAAAVAMGFAGSAHAQVATGGLPPGNGRDALVTACTQCHSLSVIVAMREGAAGWRKHVYNMVLRGAQLNSREADAVMAYLVANFGPAAVPAANEKVTLPLGPGRELVETRCTACHDLERVTGIKRPSAEWATLVANMIGRGAVAAPEEAKAIASYLATNFGGE